MTLIKKHQSIELLLIIDWN